MRLPTLGRLAASNHRVRPVLATGDPAASVLLSCPTPNARMEYSLNGSAWQSYSAPFYLPNAAVVSTRASAANLAAFEGAARFGTSTLRGQWNIVSALVPVAGGNTPANVLSDRLNAYWQTPQLPTNPVTPHHVIIDFTRALNVSNIIFTGPTTKNLSLVNDYEIYLSDDLANWGKPTFKGSFPKRGNE